MLSAPEAKICAVLLCDAAQQNTEQKRDSVQQNAPQPKEPARVDAQQRTNTNVEADAQKRLQQEKERAAQRNDPNKEKDTK